MEETHRITPPTGLSHSLRNRGITSELSLRLVSPHESGPLGYMPAIERVSRT